MNSILIPSAMYKTSLLKLLYLSRDTGCLFEFLSQNKINNLAELLNKPSEKQSLLCFSAMSANDSEVIALISMGADPMLTSQIVVDGCNEMGLRDDYDETYDMRDETHYVCDLAIIAKSCQFETFTKSVDSVLTRNKLDFSRLVESLIIVRLPNLDKYLRYILDGLREKGMLHKYLNLIDNSYLKTVFEEYKREDDPTIFGVLFEYGLVATTRIDHQFTVNDLMEKDSEIRRLYEKASMSATKKAK